MNESSPTYVRGILLIKWLCVFAGEQALLVGAIDFSLYPSPDFFVDYIKKLVEIDFNKDSIPYENIIF